MIIFNNLYYAGHLWSITPSNLHQLQLEKIWYTFEGLVLNSVFGLGSKE